MDWTHFQQKKARAQTTKGVGMINRPFISFAILCAILACGQLSNGETPPKPKKLHKEALKLAKSGAIESSLQYFRAAVRADPSNYEYMNNLGVTEMRMQSFRKASYRFFNSLKLSNGEYARAWDNIEELKAFVSDDDFITFYHDWLGLNDDNSPIPGLDFDDVSYGIKHKTKALPVIDYETFFDPSNETARSYATGYKPYMLINGMNHWDLDVLGNKELLTEHFKSSRVDYYPHNMREEDVRPYFSELGSAIDNFENPTGLFDRIDASERTAYIQWNMKDAEWDKMKELGEPV